MILSGFLLRINIDKAKPHEIIPISFDLQEVLQEIYSNIKNLLPHLKPKKTAKILP